MSVVPLRLAKVSYLEHISSSSDRSNNESFNDITTKPFKPKTSHPNPSRNLSGRTSSSRYTDVASLESSDKNRTNPSSFSTSTDASHSYSTYNSYTHSSASLSSHHTDSNSLNGSSRHSVSHNSSSAPNQRHSRSLLPIPENTSNPRPNPQSNLYDNIVAPKPTKAFSSSNIIIKQVSLPNDSPLEYFSNHSISSAGQRRYSAHSNHTSNLHQRLPESNTNSNDNNNTNSSTAERATAPNFTSNNDSRSVELQPPVPVGAAPSTSSKERQIDSSDANANADTYMNNNHNILSADANADMHSLAQSSVIQYKRSTSPQSTLRRSRAITRSSGWRRKVGFFGEKLRLRFRNWRNIAKHRILRRKARPMVTNKYNKHTLISREGTLLESSRAKSRKSQDKLKKQISNIITNSEGSTSELLNDKGFLRKYAEKKRLKQKAPSTKRNRTLKKKISLLGNNHYHHRNHNNNNNNNKNDFGDELALIPPAADYLNSINNGNGKRDLSNCSQLTMQNVEKFLSLPKYQPLKKDIIEKYVAEVSEEIQNNMDKSLIGNDHGTAANSSTDTNPDEQPKSNPVVVSTVQSANDVRKHSIEVSSKNPILRNNSIANSISPASEKTAVSTSGSANVAGKKSVESMGSNVNCQISNPSSPNEVCHPENSDEDADAEYENEEYARSVQTSAIIDPEADPVGYENMVSNWSAFLQSAIVQRAALKLEIIHSQNNMTSPTTAATTIANQSIGNYSTDANTTIGNRSVTSEDGVKRLTILDRLLGDCISDEEEENAKRLGGDENYDDNATVTESSLRDDASSVATSKTVFSPFPASRVSLANDQLKSLENDISKDNNNNSTVITKIDDNLPELQQPQQALNAGGVHVPNSGAVEVSSIHVDSENENENDNASLSSSTTVDSGASSVKTSSASDSKTHFYSIGNNDSRSHSKEPNDHGVITAAGNINAAPGLVNIIQSDGSSRVIQDIDLTRSNTVVIKQEYHNEHANASKKFINSTKSILDILSEQGASISDIDVDISRFSNNNSNNGQRKISIKRITPSNKAFSDMSRSSSNASSINISPLNIRAADGYANTTARARARAGAGRSASLQQPKKYSSMNDISGLKLENNLRSISVSSYGQATNAAAAGYQNDNGNFARGASASMNYTRQLQNRPLSMRYNRKSNNAAIIRFLSQQHQEDIITEF